MKTFMIPYFELSTFNFSIKLIGNQKIAFFCFKIFNKICSRSSWLNIGYLILKI